MLQLVILKDHLDEARPQPYNLFVDYMPYSRMDRRVGSMVFSLRTAARLINGLRFQRVTVVEPHSDVTLALLDRAQPLYWTKEVLPDVKSRPCGPAPWLLRGTVSSLCPTIWIVGKHR